MKYQAVKGMEDILPQDIKIWQRLEATARKTLESYGYEEIRTPVLEETSVFVRSIGETTDIVTKEMFTFSDRKERSLTLRPEGTAPIVRAYIEHSLDQASQVLRLYYIAPMFRSERPQKGRSRQFHQIGVEAFGANSPHADAEIIIQMNNLLKELGLSDFTIKLNSLGCKDDKNKFAEQLKKYLEGRKNQLCEDCRNRINKNVLRALDCKNDCCAGVVRAAPNILDSLCRPCKDHFDVLKDCLEKMKIAFKETKNLVRGLDYYTGTVFEVTHPALGAQDAIGAGGRYDNLVKDLGGPNVGAVGYALGLERMIIALNVKPESFHNPKVIFIATLGDGAKIEGMRIAEELRSEFPGVVVLTDITNASLKSQMRSADKNGAKAVIIIGEDELKEEKVTIKDMTAKDKQINVVKSAILEETRKILC